MKIVVAKGKPALIMHVIIFSQPHEKCGCYGNGNSQINAKTYDS